MTAPPLPTNEPFLRELLNRACRRSGAGSALARMAGQSSAAITAQRSGKQRISQQVAAQLGYVLKWVKRKS